MLSQYKKGLANEGLFGPRPSYLSILLAQSNSCSGSDLSLGSAKILLRSEPSLTPLLAPPKSCSSSDNAD